MIYEERHRPWRYGHRLARFFSDFFLRGGGVSVGGAPQEFLFRLSVNPPTRPFVSSWPVRCTKCKRCVAALAWLPFFTHSVCPSACDSFHDDLRVRRETMLLMLSILLLMSLTVYGMVGSFAVDLWTAVMAYGWLE